MAEQLRYEQTLQRLNMPNVDFAAEKEIARGYNQISAKLDQMSSFFMKQAEGQAKIEGAEYGAENAPTPQQIEDAFDFKSDINTLPKIDSKDLAPSFDSTTPLPSLSVKDVGQKTEMQDKSMSSR